jgi:hypothetical protein
VRLQEFRKLGSGTSTVSPEPLVRVEIDRAFRATHDLDDMGDDEAQPQAPTEFDRGRKRPLAGI